jgi:hypothetical protein
VPAMMVQNVSVMVLIMRSVQKPTHQPNFQI